MRDEELLEQVEERENYMILYRFQNCVRNMLKVKQKKEDFVPQSWIERLEIPSTACEYTSEQWEQVQGMKTDLECLANELDLVFREC